jgi:hypothetical protein
MELQILERTDEYLIAIWGRLLLIRWHDRPTAAGIERTVAHVAPLAERGASVAMFSLIPPRSAGPPDPAAQEAIRRMSATATPGLKGVAIVFEGSGFIAASVVALTLKLSGSRSAGTPTRVFRTLEDAVRWAERGLGPPPLDSKGLKEALLAATK